MASSYSTNLKIELQATGENSGTWGTITNTNLGTALEQAVVGYGNPSYATDANLTLTYTDTNAAQAARALVLNVTSAVSLTATRELVVPTIQKQYIVQNNTTGSQSITVKTSGGTGITVTSGRKAHLYVNGTDVIFMDDFVDINGGAIDGTTIGASSASTGAFSTLSATGNVNFDGGTFTFNDSGADKDFRVEGDTDANLLFSDASTDRIGVGTSTPATKLDVNGTITATAANVATVNVTTLDATNIEVTNLKAKDGTAAGSIADSTGVVTLASSVLTTTDINGGTIDGTTIGGSSAAAGTFTTLTASSIATFAAGSAGAPSITTTGDTNTGLFFPAADTIGFTEGGVEAARFDSSGNLGIGTTSPVSRLDVSSSLGSTPGYNVNALTVRSTATAGVGVGPSLMFSGKTNNGTADYAFAAMQGIKASAGAENYSGSLLFYLQNSGGSALLDEHMRLTTTGLGIGTSSPGYKLDATASAATVANFNRTTSSGSTVAVQVAGSTVGTLGSDTGGNGRFDISSVTGGASANAIQFSRSGGTLSMLLDSSGNLGIGVTPSAWGSGTKAIDLGSGTALWNPGSTTNTALLTNAYHNGTNYIYKATAVATNYLSTAGQHQWFNAASGTAGNTITFTQAMTLDASGNLGVGTTSPTFASGSGLEIQRESANATLRVDRGTTGDSALEVRAESSQTAVWTTSNTPMLFGTNNTERVRIMSDGAIGVNRTNPNAYGQFAVRWDPTATSVNNGVGISVDVANNTTNAVFAQWVNENGSGIGSVTRVAQTNAVAYNTSSDRRLKNNIAPADDAGAVIDAIEIVKHDWKEGGSVRYGVVAQDLYVIAPEAVSPGEPDGVEQPKRPWGVDYSKLVPMMMKELQSLRKRVAELESK